MHPGVYLALLCAAGGLMLAAARHERPVIAARWGPGRSFHGLQKLGLWPELLEAELRHQRITKQELKGVHQVGVRAGRVLVPAVGRPFVRLKVGVVERRGRARARTSATRRRAARRRRFLLAVKPRSRDARATIGTGARCRAQWFLASSTLRSGRGRRERSARTKTRRSPGHVKAGARRSRTKRLQRETSVADGGRCETYRPGAAA
jgi:hypothetical protein